METSCPPNPVSHAGPKEGLVPMQPCSCCDLPRAVLHQPKARLEHLSAPLLASPALQPLAPFPAAGAGCPWVAISPRHADLCMLPAL